MGERAVREVPERPLAADRLVDGGGHDVAPRPGTVAVDGRRGASCWTPGPGARRSRSRRAPGTGSRAPAAGRPPAAARARAPRRDGRLGRPRLAGLVGAARLVRPGGAARRRLRGDGPRASAGQWTYPLRRGQRWPVGPGAGRTAGTAAVRPRPCAGPARRTPGPRAGVRRTRTRSGPSGSSSAISSSSSARPPSPLRRRPRHLELRPSLDDDLVAVAVPGQRHRADPERLDERLVEGRRVVVGRQRGPRGRTRPRRATSARRSAMPLREDRDLHLLQDDRDERAAAPSPGGRRSGCRAGRRCRRRSDREDRSRRCVETWRDSTPPARSPVPPAAPASRKGSPRPAPRRRPGGPRRPCSRRSRGLACRTSARRRPPPS